ncbi:MAG TPA: MBL fold metallo-hydrolase, partial [Desulfatiglandales bacterium]|nr:MBL fold metallo-hydrolase [Desulfatiglandales bacterium]
INLGIIDKIVLSHAHYDHTGGLREVLRRTGKLDIIAHPSIWVPKYNKDPSEEIPEYTGIPFAREELEGLASFGLSKEPAHISRTLMTTGEIPTVTDFENIDPKFYVKERDELRADTFPDDLALIAKTSRGLVVVLGCAHRGIINTIRHARKVAGEDRVYAVIGGTHLYSKTDEQIGKTIEALKEIGVQKIGISHCTGFNAAIHIAKAYEDQFFFNNAGTVTIVD